MSSNVRSTNRRPGFVSAKTTVSTASLSVVSSFWGRKEDVGEKVVVGLVAVVVGVEEDMVEVASEDNGEGGDVLSNLRLALPFGKDQRLVSARRQPGSDEVLHCEDLSHFIG